MSPNKLQYITDLDVFKTQQVYYTPTKSASVLHPTKSASFS